MNWAGQIEEKPSEGLLPHRHDNGLYTVFKASRNRVDLKLSLDPSVWQEEAGTSSAKEIVQVILDGSAAMNHHWVLGPKSSVCRMTSVLFGIARLINPQKQELVCGFLSSNRLMRIRPGESAQNIENSIQRVRKEERLQTPYPFSRPAYETILTEYGPRFKRVFVVSDSVLFDSNDLSLKLSLPTRLRLHRDESRPYDPDEEAPILFPHDDVLDETALNPFFSKETGSIGLVQINLGEALPVAWEPSAAVLSIRGDHFILRWQANTLATEAKVLFAERHPSAVKISVQIVREHDTADSSFVEAPITADLAPLNGSDFGKLTDGELAEWLKFDTPNWQCPVCNRNDPHLLDVFEGQILERLVFASLHHLKGGYLLLRAGAPEWHFFTTGCQIDGVAFVIIDGKLHCRQGAGMLSKVSQHAAFYRQSNNSNTYYICRIW